MLRPNKHSHPDQTVLAASTVLLAELRRKRAVPYGDLKAVLDKASHGSDFLFTPAINLLYLLGLVEYRATADLFEYAGQ
ncbi:ABC-three component system middle component 8 [Micromonospora tarapacensis]|uniref:ABC-three component system middle component 8 n=1 Tax=Micromonospora tarapacensis TaxID=2835305 RepID=UPI002F42D718